MFPTQNCRLRQSTGRWFVSDPRGSGSVPRSVAPTRGSDARLLIVGDGPERISLEEQAKRLGLTGTVRFAGQVPPSEVQALLGQARGVVMPSLFYECFPRTLVEAMCAGRPVIASTTGALDELVSGDMGLHFESLDILALGNSLRRLYENSALADQLGAAARAGYLARYTPERNFKLLSEIYAFAMNHGRPRRDALPVCQGVPA
jgi:glycosyltransferase involved in cell wall biosynthesis